MNNTDFRYTGEICPVCNENFNPEDDIVVCPLCGTPHHRDCYKKNGECAHNEKHNEGYRWVHAHTAPPSSPENKENTAPPFNPYTTQGETHNSRDAASTVFWGTPQNPFDAYPKELDEGVATEEAAEFVQMNAFKYLQNFFYQKSGKKTFNWAAFLFAPYWFFYRKMNKIGIIFMSVMLGISILLSIPSATTDFMNDLSEWSYKYSDSSGIDTEEEQAAYIESYTTDFQKLMSENTLGAAIVVADSVISLILHLVAGFMANKRYYNHTVSKIRQIKAETAEHELRKLKFYKEGGMSMTRAFLAVMANDVAIMALNMLFSMFN